MKENVYPSVYNHFNKFTRIFNLDNGCSYVEDVTTNDFTVIDSTKYSKDGDPNSIVFSRYKGFHVKGDKLVGGLYEPLKVINRSKSLAEMVNEQAEQIDVDSNSELLGEIFGDISGTPLSNNFNERDIYISQVVSKVNRLDEALKKMFDTMTYMSKHMEKLEQDNQNLKSLVSQVLNHEVPEEFAKNVLEDIFKEEL